MSEKQLLEETSPEVLEALLLELEDEAEKAEGERQQAELRSRVG